MDAVTGAVVITGLTTVGKPTAQALTSMVSRILGPSLDAVGQGVAAPLAAWAKRRGKRASGTLIEAAQILHEAHIEPQPVPGRLLMPILEHSSLEEDDDLHHRWAALLANSATPNNKVLPAFAEILHQLTSVQANILHWMYERKYQDSSLGFPTWPDFDRREIEETFDLSPEYYALLIADLERLQLIEGRRNLEMPGGVVDIGQLTALVVGRWNSKVKFNSVGLTVIGINFVMACTPPGASK